jgi:hypothetical protein
MKKLRGRGVSPAMIVAGVALSVALAGTAIAGPGANVSAVSKAKVKRIARGQANKVLNGREANLNVNSAKTASPTGPSGGDLAGEYPNPELAGRTVGADQLKSVTAVVGQGVQVAQGASAEASVTCPPGTRLVSIGFEWAGDQTGTSIIYASPTFVGDPNTTAVVRGRNTGNANTLFAEASCLEQ